jgi:hypothetical protein
VSWPENVLERFGKLRRGGRPRQWSARCPAHEDRTPSLSLGIGRRGHLLVHCMANCTVQAVLAAAGLTMSDLFPPDQRNPDGPYNRPRPEAPPRRLVVEYNYADEEGRLLYQNCRYEPKEFRQRRPDGQGGWHWNLDGVRLVLYRLPQIVKANPRLPVVVVEGERDVLTLEALGLLATTGTGGTGMGWRDSYSLSLRGRRVAVLPDNDEAGLKHAERAAGSLILGGAASVRLVRLPGLAEGGDVTDWLGAGKTRPELLAVLKAAPEWRPLTKES